jgi:hypothetical protein
VAKRATRTAYFIFFNLLSKQLKNMKYAVLVALLATASARHHHHHELVATPDESRAAW